MADVQLEKGFTRIANELLQALMIFEFSGAEWSVCIAIIRLTYGYHQKKRQISYGEIAKMTGLHRITVAKVASKLAEKNVLGKQKTRGKMTANILWINKDYATWAVSLRANRSVSQMTNRYVSQMVNHIKKEKKYKEISNFKNKFLSEKTIN